MVKPKVSNQKGPDNPKHSFSSTGTYETLTPEAKKLAQLIPAMQDDECVVWEKNMIEGKPYGRVYYEGNMRHAARAIYSIVHGPIPEGLVVRHKCKTKTCVNINHLELGTHRDNMHDKFRDGTLPCGENHSKAVISEAVILDVFYRWKEGVSLRYLAKMYDVPEGALWQARQGNNWKHLGLDWTRSPRYIGTNKRYLNETQVIEIHKKWRRGIDMGWIAEEYGVSAGALSNIVKGRSWGKLGLEWIR